MTATHDSDDEAPDAAPMPEADAYSASEEEEIAARLEALGYLE
jgi:hypothetical protein